MAERRGLRRARGLFLKKDGMEVWASGAAVSLKNRGVELAPVREAKDARWEVRLLQDVLQQVLKVLPQMSGGCVIEQRLDGRLTASSLRSARGDQR